MFALYLLFFFPGFFAFLLTYQLHFFVQTGHQSRMHICRPFIQWLKEAIDLLDEGGDESQRIRTYRCHLTLCDLQQ